MSWRQTWNYDEKWKCTECGAGKPPNLGCYQDNRETDPKPYNKHQRVCGRQCANVRKLRLQAARRAGRIGPGSQTSR